MAWYVETVDGRVAVGPFPSKEEAESYKQRAEAAEGVTFREPRELKPASEFFDAYDLWLDQQFGHMDDPGDREGW